MNEEELYKKITESDLVLRESIAFNKKVYSTYAKLRRLGFRFRPKQIASVMYPNMYIEEYKHLNISDVTLIVEVLKQ